METMFLAFECFILTSTEKEITQTRFKVRAYCKKAEKRESRGTKRASAREQSGETLVSKDSRVALLSGMLYIESSAPPRSLFVLQVYGNI